ncbi:hypothetical protein KEM60_02754 [Austwickia sp. TVS 96-490-7B]|uniref:ATP-binding cassette domain-containing protein n=1 Tax=Austwickia sp. TVS 96-490-7B TaxID=2830843 RepID=UPI001C57C47A|nr:ATP-binding cassette domain-containing protein [Austwickia sp. TVS 96-490-7B]MBW3086531.1 hypothetical protein [Austwickia sp. TVS 96-490-7B]
MPSVRDLIPPADDTPTVPTELPHQHRPSHLRLFTQDPASGELAIRARGLHLTGRRGTVLAPIDLDIAPGTLTVVTGHSGTGKTSLLLTLVGRMRPSSGSELTVLGRPLPLRAISVQHRTSAMGIAGLDDLDEEVSVSACVRERQAWLAPWWKLIRTPDDHTVADICRPAFGDLPTPAARQVVHELPEASNLLLRVALALLSNPDLIVIDDIDQLRDTAERDLVWHRLEELAAEGLTIVTTCAGAGELDRVPWTIRPGHIELPDHDVATLRGRRH